MEHNPCFHGTDPHPPPRPDFPTELNHFEFEFPTVISSDPCTSPTLPNDIVFCNKILGRRTDSNPPPPQGQGVRKNPFLLRSESFGKINYGQHNGSISYLHSFPADESRRRRCSGRWKHNNGLFGGLKYPLQMELSDIKMRQGRRQPVSLPRLTVGCDGETETGGGRKSRWGLVRRLSLRRRGPPMSPFAKASFGCLPIPIPLAVK